MTAAAVAALVVAGVAWMSAPAAARWAEQPAVKVLYEDARREGQVVLWGTQQRELSWVPRAFADMFPGIAVKTLGDGDIVTRALNESRSSHYDFDALWTPLNGAVPIVQRSLAAAMDWSQFGVADSNLAFDGKMGFTNNVVYVIAYSTDYVADADVPESWSGLIDARFAAKTVSSLFALPRLVAGLGQAWGDERALQFTRDLIVRTEILVTRGPRDSFLKAGDRPYAVAELDTLARLWATDGLPIRYKVPVPVVASQFGVMAMANAPHPNAARLLAGWLASREGKAARERATGAVDYRADSASALAQRIRAAGAQMIFDTVESARARDALAERATLMLSR